MGFHELFDREDVLSILQETLSDYYRNVYPQQNIVVSYEKQNDAAEFCMIPLIGAIMQTRPCAAIRKRFYNSYNIRSNPIKHIGAKILVFLSMHFVKLASNKERLYVAPRTSVNEQTLYSYCNRSIRLFDYANCKTVSIQKKGFTEKFFQNQLNFRLNNPYDFIPPILRSGDTWFEEQIYDGMMLARITDTVEYEKAQQQVLSYLCRIEEDTLEYWDSQNYVLSLVRRLETMLKETVQKKATKQHDYAKALVRRISGFLGNIPEQIPMVISHKDLQGGNVLVTDEKTWIIDWETQGRGCRWFDAITLLYGTRYYGGIRRLMADAAADTLSEQLGPTEGWSAKQILAVFLLEDLEFYLEDMLELPGTAGSATFDRYMAKIQEIDWNTVF